MIDQQTKQLILDTAQIVDVVSDYVTLKRTGASYKGLCPFHNDHKPSFSVSPSKNLCKCFVCGGGGSPVNFVMQIEGLGYYDALRKLEPFGEGNPEPVFGLRDVRFSEVKSVGGGQHATFTFDNELIPRAVWWNHGRDVEAIRAHDMPRDVLFTLLVSEYGGEPHLELKLLDVRVAASGAN